MVTELKEHAGRVHREILKELSPYILSEGDEYYVSLHPDNYRRVVKPASSYSQQARELQTAMRAWLANTKIFRSVNQIGRLEHGFIVLLVRKSFLRFTLEMRIQRRPTLQTGASVMLP